MVLREGYSEYPLPMNMADKIMIGPTIRTRIGCCICVSFVVDVRSSDKIVWNCLLADAAVMWQKITTRITQANKSGFIISYDVACVRGKLKVNQVSKMLLFPRQLEYEATSSC